MSGPRLRRLTAEQLLSRVTAGIPDERNPVTHVAHLPERLPRHASWPEWACADVVEALRRSGVERPWTHQVEAASLAWSGHDVVISTGTASGKSMAYQLPVLSSLLEDPKATALYLAPTKALGADQLRSVRSMGLDGIRPASYDGDTPIPERKLGRDHARWVFTNPDMLHRGVLSTHARWARFFRKLTYVVVDECHGYRGVFGSHVALLLRRLRRVARHYGADPVFVLASATTAQPASSPPCSPARLPPPWWMTPRLAVRERWHCGNRRCWTNSLARTARRCGARLAPKLPESLPIWSSKEHGHWRSSVPGVVRS